MSNRVLIRLIRFVSRFTIYLCNAIYFSTIFSTPCKWFMKKIVFCVFDLNRTLEASFSVKSGILDNNFSFPLFFFEEFLFPSGWTIRNNVVGNSMARTVQAAAAALFHLLTASMWHTHSLMVPAPAYINMCRAAAFVNVVVFRWDSVVSPHRFSP